jgi:3-hydroxyacyl-[acyl-carrier-protein] dehydratase
MTENTGAMDITQIMKFLPHRYPFLLVDRVLELVPNERVVAIKNVTMNEPQFPGHFPHHLVMPGVLMIEALAQTAGLLAFKSGGKEINDNSVVYFVGIDGARFKRPVVPGDQLRMEATVLRTTRGI